MSAIEKFTQVVEQVLGPYLDRSGATLYSTGDTLRPGPVYLLGTNPGGGNDDKDTIRASLAALPFKTENSYTKEIWDTGLEPGQAPLQRRVKALIESGLGLDLEQVCAANLVFLRTRRVTDLNFWSAAKLCWPVHQHVLNVVQPRMIVAFGNSQGSAFGFLAHQLQAKEVERIDAGHGSWTCRGFRTTWDGRPLYVAGLPHMSYYSPTDRTKQVRPNLAKWLRESLASCAGPRA